MDSVIVDNIKVHYLWCYAEVALIAYMIAIW